MTATEKKQAVFALKTTVGVIGFLIVTLCGLTTNSLYGEISRVEATVIEHKVKTDSQESLINQINLATSTILVELKWQKKYIEHIAKTVNKLETK